MRGEEVLKEYLKHSEPAFTVPGLADGFVPQGIGYDAETDCFFLSGYMDRREPSPVFCIDKKSRKLIRKITLRKESGEIFRGHAGGLSVYNGHIYVAGGMDACMYRLPTEEALRAEGEEPLCTEKVSLCDEKGHIRVSFTAVDEGMLYAGEFHRRPIYHTHRSHRVQRGNLRQRAYLLAFTVGENGKAIPARVYSIPDNIQGACIAEGHLFLTQSHGLLPGTVLAYSLSEMDTEGTRTVLGKEVPLFLLTKKNCKKATSIPLLPEEIIPADGKLHILYEAAANRYHFGKKIGLDKVFATAPEYFLH